MKNVILFGPPGSGKGTQSKKLLEEHDYEYIATGDIIREEIEKGTKFGLYAQRLIDVGNYVPDNLITEVVKNKIIVSNKAKFLFDGFPRTVQQAKFLDQFMFERKNPIEVVVYFDVPRNVLEERILSRGEKEGRADDNSTAFQTRIDIYKKNTEGVLNYFKQRGKVAVVDGNNEIADIHLKVKEAII